MDLQFYTILPHYKSKYQLDFLTTYMHSWASASRKLIGIGIWHPEFLVRYQTKKMPDCVSLVRYWTGFGIVLFFSVRDQTDWMPDSPAFRHFYRYVNRHWHWHGMQHWHEHATWTWTCSMDLVMQHGPGQCTCMDARMPECRWKAQSGIVSFPLVYMA
jgi:hypothetical protein